MLFFSSVPVSAESGHLGTNLLDNGGFENWSGTDPDSWDPAHGDWSLSRTKGFYGNSSLKATTSRYSKGWSSIVSQESGNNWFSVDEGETYFIRSAMAYSNARGSHIKFQTWDSERQQWENQRNLPGGKTGSAGWVEQYDFLRVPDNHTRGRVILQAGYVDDEGAGNASTRFDALMFVEPEVENPVKYSGEVVLDPDTDFWLIDSSTELRLDDLSEGKALVSLTKNGETLAQTVLRNGDGAVSMDYGGEPYLVFRVDTVFTGTGGGKVVLKEVLAGSSKGKETESMPGENLVVNPSFETLDADSYPVGWSDANPGWTAEIDSSTAYTGNRSLKVSTTKDSGWAWIKGEKVPVTGGENYLFQSVMKARNVEDSHVKWWGWTDGGEKIQITPFVPGGQRGTFDWKRFGALIEVPENVVEVQPVLNPGTVLNESRGEAVTWVDDVSVELPGVSDPVMFVAEPSGTVEVDGDDSVRFVNGSVLYLHEGFVVARAGKEAEELSVDGEMVASWDFDNESVMSLVAASYGGAVPVLEVKPVTREVVTGRGQYVFEVKNVGEEGFTGDVSITVSGPGFQDQLNLDSGLEPGDTKRFTLPVTIDTTGNHEVSVELSRDYAKTFTLPLTVTTRGTPEAVSITKVEEVDEELKVGLKVYVKENQKFVDPRFPVKMQILKMDGNRKRNIYSSNATVTSLTPTITIDRDRFYQGHGVYLLEVRAGDGYTARPLAVGLGGPEKRDILAGGPVVLLLLGLLGVEAVRRRLEKPMYGRFDIATLVTGSIVTVVLALYGSGAVFYAAALALFGGGLYVAGRADSRLKTLLDTSDALTSYLTLVAVFFGGTLLIGNSDYDLAAALIVPLIYGLALTAKEHFLSRYD